MNTILHTYDVDGYYAGSSEMPPFAAAPNPKCATLDSLPTFNPITERLRYVSDGWVVESIPQPVPETLVPEQEPQFPRFYGNTKLDLFTPTEQMTVAEAAATIPPVALTFYRMINAAYMSYEDPEAEQGLSLLVSYGLLTQERKDEIVSQMQPR